MLPSQLLKKQISDSRRNVDSCLSLAGRASTSDKARWLQMAQFWEGRAKQAERELQDFPSSQVVTLRG